MCVFLWMLFSLPLFSLLFSPSLYLSEDGGSAHSFPFSLQAKERPIADTHPHATIMFLDLVSFTAVFFGFTFWYLTIAWTDP